MVRSPEGPGRGVAGTKATAAATHCNPGLCVLMSKGGVTTGPPSSGCLQSSQDSARLAARQGECALLNCTVTIGTRGTQEPAQPADAHPTITPLRVHALRVLTLCRHWARADDQDIAWTGGASAAAECRRPASSPAPLQGRPISCTGSPRKQDSQARGQQLAQKCRSSEPHEMLGVGGSGREAGTGTHTDWSDHPGQPESRRPGTCSRGSPT